MRTFPCCHGSLGWRAHATDNAFADGVKTGTCKYVVSFCSSHLTAVSLATRSLRSYNVLPSNVAHLKAVGLFT